MIKQLWNKVPPFLKNRYILTALGFFFWMLFFDQNDLISQIKLKNQLYELEKDKEYYKEQIQVTQEELENLLNDNEKLERFAREKYLMKKPDEDIFVIVYED
tara:strand:+ start:170 stop:475 length:306 start_codon:yes stop_codon:yes gene_type:complete